MRGCLQAVESVKQHHRRHQRIPEQAIAEPAHGGEIQAQGARVRTAGWRAGTSRCRWRTSAHCDAQAMPAMPWSAPALASDLQDAIEVGGDLLGPQRRTRRRARPCPSHAQRVVVGDAAAGGDEAGVVAIGDRGAVHAVAQGFARGAVVEGDGRHATGHRLQGHVAEGFAVAREHEQVAAGEMARQRFAALHAAEDEVGVVAGQSFARWAVADPYEARSGAVRCNCPEGAHGQAEVLFRCDAADVDRGEIISPTAPCAAQVARSRLTGSNCTVSTARGRRTTLANPRACRKPGEFMRRGHQRRLAAIVEAAHPAQRGLLQESGAIVAHVVVEAGVEASRGRDPQVRRAARRADQPADLRWRRRWRRAACCIHKSREFACRRQAECWNPG